MRHSALSPEARLVLRTAADGVSPAEWEALARAVRDWPRVFQLADKQVALLALWRALTSNPAALALAPQGFVEALRRVALVEDLRMQQLAKRAQQTIAALHAAQVPVMLLKGSAIGALVDPSFRSRPMTDVDALVHREQVAQASEAILASGWRVTDNPAYLEMLKDAHHLPHFVDATQPGIRLELHVALMPDDQPFGIEEAMFWREARSAPAPFAGAVVPSPEHMMLHAAVHFAWQHMLMFGAWRTFRMVQLVSALPGLDWDRVVGTARAVKAGTTLYWTLRLSQAFAGVAVPASVLRDLAPPTPEFVRAGLERHFLALNVPGEGPSSPSVKLTRRLWWAALRPTWSGHSDPGRYDPDNRWAQAYGTASTETSLQRYLRHARNVGDWLRFARQTLLG